MWETGEKSGMWEIRAKNLGTWDIIFVCHPSRYDRDPGRKTINHIIKPRHPTMDYAVTCVCGHAGA